MGRGQDEQETAPRHDGHDQFPQLSQGRGSRGIRADRAGRSLDRAPRHAAIGQVVEIGGGGARVEFEPGRLREIAGDPDPSIAISGQVGGHVKLEAGQRWLLANVRGLKMHDGEGGMIIAEIDFLGEGEEHEQSGKLINFKRGITSYPLPGGQVFPVSGDDLKQMFAADERAHIEIGTVYPTKDVRGALYIDALLGKHFALLGSTGTGKSTAAALIMHRICDLSPEGHIVMIDPHGEYSAAFKSNGELFNVENLAMPYWLMNFEEHCEVFVTAHGSERPARHGHPGQMPAPGARQEPRPRKA